MTKDWLDWHRGYDDPDSYLNRRLAVVTGMIATFLDEAPPGPLRCLSLCAGQGRDLATGAGGHPRGDDLVGAAIEIDPRFAAAARTNLAAAGLDIEVRAADAGDPRTFADVVPVDLLVLVGIFGNIAEGDIRRTVAATPALCRAGATVIWSRHRRDPDLTPRLREWFRAAGTEEVAFVSPGPGAFAVGCSRVTAAARTSLPDRLFTFVDE